MSWMDALSRLNSDQNSPIGKAAHNSARTNA
jgi:hypothetical protein